MSSSIATAGVLRGIAAATLLAVCLAAPAHAEQDGVADEMDWMSVDEVRAEIVGRVTEGTYTDGRAWSENVKDDGTTLLSEEGVQQAGVWWFDASEMLCFRYESEDSPGGCFRYKRISRNCYHHWFPGSMIDSPLATPGAWQPNGYLWRRGEPSTCEAQPSS